MSGIKLPWDLIPGSDEPAPGMVPIQRDEACVELGRHLARFADQEEPPGAPPRCHDCAFRAGTLANTSLTVANAAKCAFEGIPFYCHHGEENGEPTRLCRGWIALAPKEVLAEIAAEIAAAHLDPRTAAPGGSAAEAGDRDPPTPGQQPGSRLPDDDDS